MTMDEIHLIDAKRLIHEALQEVLEVKDLRLQKTRYYLHNAHEEIRRIVENATE